MFQISFVKKIKKVLTILIAILILAGCVNSKSTLAPSQMPIQYTAEPIPSSTLTPTKNNVPSQISNTSTITPTSTPKPTRDLYSSLGTLDFTQGPVFIKTQISLENEYLYKDIDVKIITTPGESENYLNLDDLTNNGVENSDILIEYSTGSAGTEYNLFPTNGATYYYSDLHGMDYDSCMEHFPFTHMFPYSYTVQSTGFRTGRDYCILTNEGRLSIVSFNHDISHSIYYQGNNLIVIVTTYRQIMPQVKSLPSTFTPGPSPTPNLFYGLNFSKKQEEILDKSAHDLLNAIMADEKNKIADLIDYPFFFDNWDNNNFLLINNRNEFLDHYSEILPYNILEELKKASVDKNLGILPENRIALEAENCRIYFHPDGKIFEINIY